MTLPAALGFGSVAQEDFVAVDPLGGGTVGAEFCFSHIFAEFAEASCAIGFEPLRARGFFGIGGAGLRGTTADTDGTVDDRDGGGGAGTSCCELFCEVDIFVETDDERVGLEDSCSDLMEVVRAGNGGAVRAVAEEPSFCGNPRGRVMKPGSLVGVKGLDGRWGLRT